MLARKKKHHRSFSQSPFLIGTIQESKLDFHKNKSTLQYKFKNLIKSIHHPALPWGEQKAFSKYTLSHVILIAALLHMRGRTAAAVHVWYFLCMYVCVCVRLIMHTAEDRGLANYTKISFSSPSFHLLSLSASIFPQPPQTNMAICILLNGLQIIRPPKMALIGVMHHIVGWFKKDNHFWCHFQTLCLPLTICLHLAKALWRNEVPSPHWN